MSADNTDSECADKEVSQDASTEPVKRHLGRPFPKGVSPNPGGRPKALRAFHAWLDECVIPKADNVVLEVLGCDDLKARGAMARWVYEMRYGKAPQAITGEDGKPLAFGVVVIPIEQ